MATKEEDELPNVHEMWSMFREAISAGLVHVVEDREPESHGYRLGNGFVIESVKHRADIEVDCITVGATKREVP